MVLKIFAAQTKKVIRNIDFLGRYGGEEFVVLLPEITEERALDIAERIRSKIEKTKLIYDKKTFKVTVSIGMTSLKKDDTVESFVERADKALYKAKESGRNKVVIF
jgi:diguanylate cyclase (GGDEF)-like protein